MEVSKKMEVKLKDACKMHLLSHIGTKNKR
jgi:hypothetical protein